MIVSLFNQTKPQRPVSCNANSSDIIIATTHSSPFVKPPSIISGLDIQVSWGRQKANFEKLTRISCCTT